MLSQILQSSVYEIVGIAFDSWMEQFKSTVTKTCRRFLNIDCNFVNINFRVQKHFGKLRLLDSWVYTTQYSKNPQLSSTRRLVGFLINEHLFVKKAGDFLCLLIKKLTICFRIINTLVKNKCQY